MLVGNNERQIVFVNDKPSPLHTQVEFLQFPSKEHEAAKGQKVSQVEVPVGYYIYCSTCQCEFQCLVDLAWREE